MKPVRSLHIIVLGCIFFSGCTHIKPAAVPDKDLGEPVRFSHRDFDLVLHRFVNDEGLIDYTGLHLDRGDLERYYLLLSTYSPDSHPELFPTSQSRLAYWINGYNAAVIRTVLTHYPLSTVQEIKPPLPFFFLPDLSGFFVFQRLTFGGKTTSLYHLENGIIRRRFTEPRIHFALNCAARSCPRLPRKAFSARNLDAELDREAHKFLAEERNLRVDLQRKTVFLSSIFRWYKDDFLDWYQQRFPRRQASLLNYVALYITGKKAEKFRVKTASYQVEYIPYDWRLNDQDLATRGSNEAEDP